jgi:GT2 family glycosyltransferase
VDNGSNQETKDYIQEVKKTYHQPVIVITNSVNLGVPRAVNQGMDACDTDIFLLHTDSEIGKGQYDWLKNTRELAHSKNDIGVCGHLIGEDYFGTWGLYLRRDVIDKVGKFDENFGLVMSDDIDYYRRVRHNGFRPQELPFKLEHVGSQTVGHMHEANWWKEKNMKLLKNKWRGIDWTKPK